MFSLQVWNKIPTLRSIDRFDKFSFLTNQQQPHVKRAKPDPAGALTRCSEVTLVCHATQTVYKPLFHFVAKLNNKSLIRRLSAVVSWDIFTRLLYFDSPYGLAKIRRDS